MTEEEFKKELNHLHFKIEANNQKLEEIKRILFMSDWEIFKEWFCEFFNINKGKH